MVIANMLNFAGWALETGGGEILCLFSISNTGADKLSGQIVGTNCRDLDPRVFFFRMTV